MRDVTWVREEVIASVRHDIWRHLTQGASLEHDVLLQAAMLLRMPAAEVRLLAQLHFVLSPAVGRLLDHMPWLVRRLRSTTAAELEASADRVRGPIHWSQTLGARAASGLPHLYVTAPARRAYDTPENRLLIFSLDAIASFGRRTGWHRSTSPDAGDTVRRRVNDATLWRHSRPLADIPAKAASPSDISRVRSGRQHRTYATVLDVIAAHQRFLARLDRAALRHAVERQALVAKDDAVLLELLCAFGLLRALTDAGFVAPGPRLLRPPLLFRGIRGDETLEVYYQTAPDELKRESIYRSVQQVHGINPGGYIPDLVLQHTRPSGRRWLLVEVKGGARGLAKSARAALTDLLAYRRAFDAALGAQDAPYGLGIAWGEGLRPDTRAEVALCSPDMLGESIAELLA